MAGKGAVVQTISLLWISSDGFVKRRLALALLFVVAAASLAALAPVAIKMIVDQVSVGAKAEHGIAPVFMILAYVASQYFSRSFSELQLWAHGTAEQRVHRRMSHRVFGHILALPMGLQLDDRTGALSQTLANGLMGYRLILMHLIHSVLPVAIQLLMMAGVLLHFGHPTFLLILVLSLFAYAVAFSIGVVRISGPGRDVSNASIAASALMTDSLLNSETIKCLDAGSYVQGRYDDALRASERKWGRFYRLKVANGLVVAAIFATSLAIAIGFAWFQLQAGRMTVGDFVLVNTYMLTVVRPLEMLGFAARDIAQGVAFIERVRRLLQEETESEIGAASERRIAGPGRLEFERVSFAYRSDREIINDLSFVLEPGKTTAIVGPSGSGKSSIVRLLLRLYEPGGGRIILDGQPISQISASELRRSIAVVPQDTVLLHDTIEFNIRLADQSSSIKDIERAAKLAHIHDTIVQFPDGYDTVVGERGTKLSGGEKQRIAIARAVVRKPRIYIFDEVTSSLDTQTESDILASLVELSNGTTTLIIAHRLAAVTHADKILVLAQGRVVEHGTHTELLRQNGTYARMWRAQRRRRDVGGLATFPAA